MLKKVIRFSVEHSLFVNLLSGFLILAGIVSFFALRREAFPNIDYDLVMIQTDYFGATPAEVEKLITIELEDELKEVDGIDEMTSVSAENISMIIIKIDPDEPDKRKVVNDIQRAVDRADELPEDSEDPLVTEIQSKNFPVINVSLSGIEDEAALQKTARQLELRLLDLPDVAKIERMGWRDKEIWVEVDPEKVGDYKLSLEEIITALGRQNLNVPGGTLTTARGDYLVRTVGEFQNAEEIRPVIVRANDLGNWIRVSDVAEVRNAFEDDKLLERTRGSMAINLTVVEKQRGDIIRLVEDVKETVAEFQKEAPPELQVSYFDDFSYYVKRRLNILKNNGVIGIFLVLASLLIFLTRTVALMTAIGIPVAFLTTFFIMHTLGLSINLITMFGLIMVLGMVVDDAIVVAENVYRHAENGESPRQATIEGASEVALPVITTVLTTIVAFVPLMFMSGIMGKFIWAIPLIVSVALTASLFECLVILPAHLADTMRYSRPTSKKENQKWFQQLQESYLKALKWVIHHRYKALGVFFAVAVFAVVLYGSFMRFVLFPQGLIEEFFIRIKTPVGTSLEETQNRLTHLEKLVQALPATDLDNFITQVGVVRESVAEPTADRGSHLGQIHVFLTPEKTKGRRFADVIIDELRKKSDEFKPLFEEITFTKVRAGPPVGKPVSVRIRGDELKKLNEAADWIKTKLRQMPGLIDIQDDYDEGKTELRVDIDEARATKAFLTVSEIATAVRNAIEGGIATTIRKTDEEIDVIVKFPEAMLKDKAIFDSIYIANRFGNMIPLKEVAELKEFPGIHVVKHFDRKRMVNVTAEVDEKKITPIEVERNLKKIFRDNLDGKFPGIDISFGGEQEETKESLHDFLRALLLALFLIFIILAANFNSIVRPLIVMMAIPFGLVGVIFAFFLHGMPLSFMALLGTIGLSGVVVNDSIVLVDFINSLRQSGMGRYDSILEAGKLRLRPVILTTITTVVGLLPVAYGIGGSDPFLKPMALAVGWGLAFSTVLTLVLIPCTYSISDDIAVHLEKLKRKIFKNAPPSPA